MCAICTDSAGWSAIEHPTVLDTPNLLFLELTPTASCVIARRNQVPGRIESRTHVLNVSVMSELLDRLYNYLRENRRGCIAGNDKVCSNIIGAKEAAGLAVKRSHL